MQAFSITYYRYMSNYIFDNIVYNWLETQFCYYAITIYYNLFLCLKSYGTDTADTKSNRTHYQTIVISSTDTFCLKQDL